MKTLDDLLQDDLNRLVDRIAVRAGHDTAAGLKPELKLRLERAEARLTGLRVALLDGYAEWLRAVDECEDLWALAGLRQDAEDAVAPRRAA